MRQNFVVKARAVGNVLFRLNRENLYMGDRYTGRCHCGKIRFSFVSEEIIEGRRCNCSLCSRKGAIMSAKYIPAKDFHPHESPDDLVAYQWNDRVIDHLFCKVCGVFPYFGNEEYGFRVNLGCVEKIDAMSLPISRVGRTARFGSGMKSDSFGLRQAKYLLQINTYRWRFFA